MKKINTLLVAHVLNLIQRVHFIYQYNNHNLNHTIRYLMNTIGPKSLSDVHRGKPIKIKHYWPRA